MSVHQELVVIGAGPAGMAAAGTAAAHGVDTLLLDEQPTPGGQIYRGIEQSLPAHLALLGKDYEAGIELVKAFRESGARYQPDTAVWSLGSQGEIGILQHGKASVVKARGDQRDWPRPIKSIRDDRKPSGASRAARNPCFMV